MPQKLFIKEVKKDPETGKETRGERTIMVARVFMDSRGTQIFLHLNGSYGYKDGSPIRDAKELDIIGDLNQRERAMGWWKIKGQRISSEFYARRKIELEKMSRDPDELASKVTDLDTALYARRPKKDKRLKAFCEPMTWVDFDFPERPPWWGMLEIAEDKNWHYHIVNPEVMDSLKEDGDEDPFPPA